MAKKEEKSMVDPLIDFLIGSGDRIVRLVVEIDTDDGLRVTFDYDTEMEN